MRVIEPRRKNNLPRQTSKTGLLVVVCLGVLAGLLIFYLSNKAENELENKNQPLLEQPVIKTEGELKTFKGQQFVDFYYRLAFPNTQRISEEAGITGGREADEHLKVLAEKRGYVLQAAPVSDVLEPADKDMTLQPKAALDWKKLRNAARQDRLELELTAGFRSAKDQTDIFLGRLEAAGVPISAIPSGNYDGQINRVLKTTALPGYSKHHTGYTADIGCPTDPGVVFEQSECFVWLSKNNYKNAKEHGWIPSYPEGAKKQGPDPEAWEYVWTGRQNLIE
jgi:D-alanyl-D-alanine carboxypeptidase